jgi:4-amino-4-deoxy-L-arabinose transferase-like glycosyltransferase
VTRRRFAVFLILIAGAAFVGRAVFIMAVTRNEDEQYDATYYLNEARYVGAGNGFVTPFSVEENADHPPLTVATLAPVSFFTDGDPLAMRFTVAVAGVGTVVLIGLLAREVGGNRVGLLAAGIAAVYPNLWVNDGLLMSETFSALTVAATLFATYRLLRAPSWTNAAGVGIACGLAALSRGELLLLVPLVVLPAIFTVREASWPRLRMALVAVTAAILTITPWVAYNLSRFEEPVFLSNGDGAVLLGSNCDQVYEGRGLGYWNFDCAFGGLTEREKSKLSARQRDLAFEYVRDNLTRAPVVALARVGRVWSVYKPFESARVNEGEGRPRVVSLAGLAMFWLMVPFAIWGALRLRGRVTLLPLLTPIALVTVVAAASYGIVRFRVPAEVPLVVLAAVGVDQLARRVRPELPYAATARRQNGTATPSSACTK